MSKKVYIDFETYSEAGFEWDENKQSWNSLPNSSKKGLPAIGIAPYATHPSTEILCMAYAFDDEPNVNVWLPGDPFPDRLQEHVDNYGQIEAWNVAFERWIWTYVGCCRYGFPLNDCIQFVCTQSRARAFCLPPSLAEAGEVLQIQNQKDKDGWRLINKFSMPRNPTIRDKRKRITFQDDPVDAMRMIDYCIRDVVAEREIDKQIPQLSTFEFKFWKIDQAINERGVSLDLKSIDNFINIAESAYKKYNARLSEITGGEVNSATEIFKLKTWLAKRGLLVESLDAAHLAELLTRQLPLDIYEALSIRDKIGSSAVKKLYAMKNKHFKGRANELFVYHAARTGRAAGAGIQPQNLPNHGLTVSICKNCEKTTSLKQFCPRCFSTELVRDQEWNSKATEDVIELTSLNDLEFCYGDAIGAISGCLRGMFVSREGYDLICSDYSAIEAVVLAAISEETWRLSVFKTHGFIYEMSASKITAIPLEEYLEYKSKNKKHHPDRKIGKVAELASGFGGSIGAWKRFKADEFLTDEQIMQAVSAWRKASPGIVKLWYGLEKAAKDSILNPQTVYSYGAIKYFTSNDILHCILPSSRFITYHRPRIIDNAITFEGYNSN